jgi:signal transduction histidine kinase
MQFNSYVVMLFTALLFAFILAIVAWRKRKVYCSYTVLWMAVGMAIWTGAGAVEAMVTGVPGKYIWSVVSYAGIVVTPPLYLILSLEYAGKTVALQRTWVRLAIWLIPCLTFVAAFTNSMHGLLWRTISLREGAFGVIGVYERGIWFWVMLLHAYALVGLAVFILMRSAWALPPIFARQHRLVALASALPFVGNFAYIMNPQWTGGFDFAPFFFTVAILVLGQAILRGRWLDLMPLPPHVLLQHLGEGVCVFDESQRLIGVNPSATRLLGISERDIGKSAGVLFARFPGIMDFPLDEKEYVGDFEDSVAGQILEAMRVAVRSPNGRFRWRLLTLRDATVRRRADQERLLLQQSLMQAHKAETVGRIAGGVAHDFNNQLMGIMGYAQLSLDLLDDDQREIREYQCKILDVADQSAKLVRHLLAYARKQPSSPKPTDLNVVIAEHLPLLQKLVGGKVRLSWLPGDDVPAICIDPLQVDQILVHLVVNAREALDMTGEIRLETMRRKLTAVPVVEWPEPLDGEYVCLSVSDSGCGVDPAVREHIFEPFVTTKGAGRGLGLATVFGIARQNHGHVLWDHAPGGMTCFSVLFPVSAER